MSFIEDLGEQTGTGLASGAIGGGLGAIFNMIGQNQQFKQAQRMQGLQVQGQEQLMDYSMQKQMDMWNATNYPAQMQQLEKAGLNPGLMYAKGGPGGITGSPQGGASGQPATNNSGTMTAAMGIMNQNALMEAQRKNLDADTAEKLSKVPVHGAEVPNIQASTENLLQGVKNLKAQEVLTKVQTDLSNIQKTIQASTIEEQIRSISQQAAMWDEQVMQAALKTTEDRALLYTRIDQAKQNLVSTMLQQALTKQQTQKTGQETQLLEKDNKYYADKWAAELSRISHQNYADIHGTGAQETQANTQAAMAAWERAMNDMTENERMAAQGIHDAMKAIIIGKILAPSGQHNKIGFKY